MAESNSVKLRHLHLPEVTRKKELRRGSYATTFEVMVHGTPFTANEVHPVLMNVNFKEKFYAECIRSSQLLHPNIVQFMGIYYPSPSAELPWLVTEMMYISLTGLIEQRVKEEKEIPFHFKISMLVDTCQGLQFLHSKSIAHRDLSSNNILLTKHLVAKIADLGMAKVMSGDGHIIDCGAQVFMPLELEAPEGTDEAVYGITIDVFALGCICLHVISMQWPAISVLDNTTRALTELQRRKQYLTGPFQQFPTLRALVCQCLDDFYEKRPAVGAVLEGLRAIHCDVVPRENNNIIQLCDYYKRLLQQKDQESTQRKEQLVCKEKELSTTLVAKKQLTAKLSEAKKQLALKHEKLLDAKEQLIESHVQLERLQSQVLADARRRNVQEPVVLRKADKRWVRPAEQEAYLAKAEKETLVNLFGRKRGGPYQSITKKMVEVRKGDKRWVRPAEPETDLAKAEKETQVLFRKFIGILNKLTPQKFEILANQVLEMPINSEDRLKGCIDRIFIRAVKEPIFSVAYAQLCRVLSKVSVEVGTGPEMKKKTFRSLLLTKCQQEFEKDKESDTVIAELKKKVEEAIPEEKKQLEEELSKKEYRLQHKYLGNIKFIGELFKLKMLSEGIMHECIRRLLQSTTDEEALECFAKLMFTIGKDLDHEKGQALIKQYIDRVQLIINAGKISSRIKFFLQDVVELRNANWVQRRENNNPQKIDQIHQEAKQEEAEKMRELAAHPGLPMGGQQVSKGSLDMDSRKKSMKDGSSKMGSDWSSGSDKDKKTLSSQPKLDSTKFRNIGKPGTQLTFAPGKFRPGGSAVTADKISRQDLKGKPSRSSGSGSKRSDSQSGSISTGGGCPTIGSGQSRRSHAVPDKQRERQKALELVSNVSGTSHCGSVLKRPAPDALSEEEVEKKSSSLIAEFCQNVDYEAAAEEVRDMKSPCKLHKLVCQIINDVLEKPAVTRSNTGKLFHHLIRKKVITKEKFTDGFTEVLEFAEDIEIDVPKIWLYLAEIVVPVVEDGTVSLDVLTKAPASIMESGKGAQLLAEVLKLSEKIMGTGHVTAMWTNSTVSYSTFKISNVEEFKKKYGLQFLPSSVVANGMDIKRLMKLLRSRDNTNTEIMNCIEKEYPESRERNLVFIRDLGMAVFKTVIYGSSRNAKYNEELFDSRITIVTKYIEPQNDSNHLRQLEFLYALQMVLHELEQPAGLATIICKKLSESGVFEDAAFHLWKTSGSESIGHGTTMLALKDFFDWLESTPVESDYSQ